MRRIRINWTQLWRPAWGWWWTAFFIIGGLFCVIFDTVGSGFWWMGVCFLVAGVGNLIGLLWWPGRIKHPPPRA